jgi:hypothetical protein
MGTAAWRVRAGLLVLVGALAVHELRYLIAGQHQDEHVHAYMPWLVPLVCALLGLAAAEFTARLVARIRDGRPAYVPAGVRWLAVSALLTAIFAFQEVTELLVTHGRLDVAQSLVVQGGWVALPLCFAVGGVIALLLRGARALLSRTWDRRRAPRTVPVNTHRRLPGSRTPRVPVIACNLAGRAPPCVVI